MDDMIERGALAVLQTETFGLDTRGANEVMLATVHQGDCTNEPFTCGLCQADDARDVTRAVHAALTPSDLATLVDNLDGQGRIAFDLWRQENIRCRADEAIAAGRIKPGQEGGEDDN